MAKNSGDKPNYLDAYTELINIYQQQGDNESAEMWTKKMKSVRNQGDFVKILILFTKIV